MRPRTQRPAVPPVPPVPSGSLFSPEGLSILRTASGSFLHSIVVLPSAAAAYMTGHIATPCLLNSTFHSRYPPRLIPAYMVEV